VIRPAVGGHLPDIEYLACADDLSTCARLAAQVQQRLERSVAEADAYCRRLRHAARTGGCRPSWTLGPGAAIDSLQPDQRRRR
jgi:hypothetical protein